jgi:hypothetical protein
MKGNKIGIIFIAIIIAIAGFGVGISFWSNSINIFGTINTGNVSCEVTDCKGTWVYEDEITEECIVSNKILENESLKLIAYSKAIKGNDNDVSIYFNNLFPCIEFKSGITIKYTGSIPVKINNISYVFNSSNKWIEDLILTKDVYTKIYDTSGNNVTIGHLLHKNDKIFADFYIHIPHNKNLTNVSGFFSANFEIIQWNEYLPPSGNNSPPSETPLDISNFVIYQTSSEKIFNLPENTTIKPGDYVVIARDCKRANFESYWGVSLTSAVYYINSENEFPSINGDETFELRDKNNTIIDGPTGQPMVAYHTVERLNATFDSTNPNSWNISDDSYATPGTGANGDGTAGLIINEYSDVSGTGNWRYEFIELYYDSE